MFPFKKDNNNNNVNERRGMSTRNKMKADNSREQINRKPLTNPSQLNFMLVLKLFKHGCS